MGRSDLEVAVVTPVWAPGVLDDEVGALRRVGSIADGKDAVAPSAGFDKVRCVADVRPGAECKTGPTDGNKVGTRRDRLFSPFGAEQCSVCDVCQASKRARDHVLDGVFDESSDTQAVYGVAGRSLGDSVLAGVNATILC